MLEYEKLGLDKFGAVFDLLIRDVFDLLIRDPTRTPKPRRGSLGDCLGPFAHLASLHRRLGDLGGRSRPRAREGLVTRPEDAPWGPTDLPNPAGIDLTTTEAPSSRSRAAARRTILPATRRRTTFSDSDDGDGGDGNRGDLSSADVPDPTKTRPLPLPKRRTPAETIMVNFLVNAIAAVAMQIQPVQSAPVCVADAREQTFKFGRGRRHEIKSKSSDEQKRRARRERAGDLHGDGLVAVFEAKRHQHDDDDVEVRAQQTMEHVAVIWEKHKGHKDVEQPRFCGT
ncbi:hypothetical protein B0T16DRAFT_384201 [Cercophora newfieldiana]|uniref:Uncharacterized protein n=1 Tax=Cercophora newfieldiana TaxID=92897 RepID=A0AA40CXK4_9PEZI|nr:hypothetical protein B0T16DRAFT_384201 [Cercophora newfieldiana]